jgi:23S rRNA (adenine2503-C2)-methyltransferase
MSKKFIKSLSEASLKSFLLEKGHKAFRSAQIYQWLWHKNAQSFSSMKNIPANLIELLEAEFALSPVQAEDMQQSSDGTIKIAFRLYDGRLAEGVLIPSGDRATACISSQVGCSLGCKFCATAKLGFMRNLESWEIYEQAYLINKLAEEKCGRKLTNIVYMGMGEPLLNYANMMSSIEMLCSETGLAMSPRRITVSTSGIEKGIRLLADDNAKFNLALSLHAATDEKRTALMPINDRKGLAGIIDAIKYYVEKTGMRPTFEYLMLGGFNDSLDDARALALFCRNFPSKVNLIEYNPVKGGSFKASAKSDTENFMSFLESKNMVASIRRSRGKDIDAACGQLAGKKEAAISPGA